MARLVTLTQLRQRARDQADMETSGANAFVDTDSLDRMINASLGVWHGMVVRAVPERYEKTQEIEADNSEGYDLPDDYLGTLAVHREYNTDYWCPLRRLMIQERTRFPATGFRGEAVGYYVSDSQLVLVPQPKSGNYRHVYVRTAPVLADGNDTVDGVNGWEQWIVYDVAAQMLMKEESDVSQLTFERDKLRVEIESAAQEREMANPQRVARVRSRPQFILGHNDPDFWSFRR